MNQHCYISHSPVSCTAETDRETDRRFTAKNTWGMSLSMSVTPNTTLHERGGSHQRLHWPQSKSLLLMQKVSQICKYLLLMLPSCFYLCSQATEASAGPIATKLWPGCRHLFTAWHTLNTASSSLDTLSQPSFCKSTTVRCIPKATRDCDINPKGSENRRKKCKVVDHRDTFLRSKLWRWWRIKWLMLSFYCHLDLFIRVVGWFWLSLSCIISKVGGMLVYLTRINRLYQFNGSRTQHSG